MALELFRGLARSYEKTLDVATLTQDRYWKKWVLQRAKAGPADSVLDIGCGTCLLEEGLEHSECSVVGVDITEQMVRVGQSKRLRGVELLSVGDAEFLPFADESFDVVVSCYVAKYCDVGRFTREIARTMKPGSRVVLYDFVRPRGLFLPFIGLYIHGVVRAVGVLLRLTGSDLAFTFRNLPGLVQGATWDSEIVPAFEKEGVTIGEAARLSGGVVAAYAGTKGEPALLKDKRKRMQRSAT